MKQLFSLIFLVCISFNLLGQAPNKLSYQSVIRNNSNTLISNQMIGLKISLLTGSINGNSVYIESHTTVSNSNGLISIEIGNGNVEFGSFTSIDWSNNSHFIKAEIDPTGGNNYTITSISQLLSVPYALFSNHSYKTLDTSLWSINGNSKIGTSSFIGTVDTFNLNFKVNNTKAGVIDFKNNNTSLGINSMQANSGNNNVSLGAYSLSNINLGSHNIGIGTYSLISNISGSGNIAVGSYSLQNLIEANANIGIGANSLRHNRYGNSNLAIGNNVLSNFDFPVWIAAYNTAVGEGSMYNTTIGYRNNGYGAYSLYHLTSGQQNTAIGIDAGQFLKTGHHNVFLGNGTGVSDSSISNSVVIGNSAIVSNSNVILLGDTSNTSINVGIGTAAPARKLHIKSVMRLEPINSPPAQPSKGDIYFDAILNKLRVYDGSVWQNCW